MLLPNMEVPRLGCAAVSLRGQAIVCGGSGRHGSLASVETYDAAEGQWQALPPMRDARERFAAAVVQGSIYVCGGWYYTEAEPSARVLRSVERFDPRLGRWEDLAPMPQRRHGLAAGALGCQLWVCGGSYGRQDVRTVEVYDVDTFAWVQMPSMHMPRNCASMAFVRF
ncbi:KLHL12 [Symbiodinium natans]|uniref:KLHL12 protein n=1 Tax=Symbiodinium natans TaxID=878477 RepID=A0A812KEZ2_9DINO|nr:KLHL12 [Symbiodinium natans]